MLDVVDYHLQDNLVAQKRFPLEVRNLLMDITLDRLRQDKDLILEYFVHPDKIF